MIPLTVYAVFCATFFHYERLTGDATLYLSIAEKYIRGDLSNAVNGYWGPLLSWLLIPFLALGSTHLFAINALNVIFGILTILGVWNLSSRFEMSDSIRTIILIPLVPVLIFISLVEPMDFLLLCILTYYFAVVFDSRYSSRIKHAFSAGISGSLIYFSKPYGFPFFISHFTIFNILHYASAFTREQKISVLRNFLVGFMLFALISGAWISLISNKYGRFTFSNMGRGVFASLGPGSEHETLEKGDPIFFDGFFAPPNETAHVIYEDPSYARKKTWSPFESEETFRHFSSNFLKNIVAVIRVYESYSRLSISIVIAYLLLLLNNPCGRLLSHRDLVYPFVTLLLFTGGYTLFHIEARYLWIANILLLLMGGKVLYTLFKTEFFRKKIVRNVFMLVFMLSFMITPIKSSVGIGNENMNKEMFLLSEELKVKYDIKGNIASNRLKLQTGTHDSWHKTLRLSYWLGSRYFGQPRENIDDKDLENELEKFDIDYFFYWEDRSDIPVFLHKHRDITQGTVSGLKVYALKE
ncbi:MAG: hypothetical protein JSW20_05680 [Nitrospiraceae bacterium]|nr:MAG: hypothetical protein JSW20_05680 [Nitrospiraceae bacterium]